MICKNSLSYLNVLFAIHNIHVNEQLSKAENSMLRLDKERLVKEVNATKVLFKIFTSFDICKFLDLDQQAELEDTVAKTESQGKLIIQLEDHVEQLQAISTPYRYVQAKKLFLN